MKKQKPKGGDSPLGFKFSFIQLELILASIRIRGKKRLT